MVSRITLAALLALAPVAAKACDPATFAVPFAAAFRAGEVFTPPEVPATIAGALCQQDAVVAGLGRVVGYKAAATSSAARQALGLTEPVLGVLTEGMLIGDGATVAIDDGARLIFELDLLARVGPDGFDAVTDRVSALAAIDAFVPFIELGDLMTPEGVPVTGPLLQAMNAGARSGVMGTPVPRWDMTEDDVAVIAGTLALDGAVVAEAPATALLGHPLDAVLWIANAAKARGMTLKPGDLLSLGSMGRLQPAVPGEIVATYTGLGLEPVSVRVMLK